MREIRNNSTSKASKVRSLWGGMDLQGFLPQLDEFYFTTAEKKILENCRCIVPNFIND